LVELLEEGAVGVDDRLLGAEELRDVRREAHVARREEHRDPGVARPDRVGHEPPLREGAVVLARREPRGERGGVVEEVGAAVAVGDADVALHRVRVDGDAAVVEAEGADAGSSFVADEVEAPLHGRLEGALHHHVVEVALAKVTVIRRAAEVADDGVGEVGRAHLRPRLDVTEERMDGRPSSSWPTLKPCKGDRAVGAADEAGSPCPVTRC
jgi:hypothetical protein